MIDTMIRCVNKFASSPSNDVFVWPQIRPQRPKMQDLTLEDQRKMNERKMQDQMANMESAGPRMWNRKPENQRRADGYATQSSGNKLRIHTVRGYSTADMRVIANCTEMDNLNCNRNVPYTRLK